jgi:hypothetical protein
LGVVPAGLPESSSSMREPSTIARIATGTRITAASAAALRRVIDRKFLTTIS